MSDLRTARLPQAALYRPWAIYKPALASVFERARIRGEAIARMTAVDIEAAVQAASMSTLGRMVGSVAVLPVSGPIFQKSDFYSWWFGGCALDRLGAAFRQYVNDPAVSAIVFDVDSPGGEVYGVPEFFQEVFTARGEKKLIAAANPFMASAAYWLACACDEIVLMPSGQAGSVGCYTTHEDLSKMLEQLGVDVTLIQYGEHKTDGNPYEPLSEEARTDIQAGVDFYGQLFDKDVARGRSVSLSDVRANFGQGRVLRAPDAKKVKMVDRIGTLDDVLAKLAPKRSRAVAAGAPARATAKKKADTVDPDDDGNCPDGYKKGDDGMCRLMSDDDESSKAAARRQADADAIAVTLALTE